jgi:hypothetical protein
LSRIGTARSRLDALAAAQPGALPARRGDGVEHQFFSQIPYAQFTASLAPVALVGLVLAFVLIAVFHRREFAGGARLVAVTPPARTHRVLMLRALIATAVLIALFFAGQPTKKGKPNPRDSAASTTPVRCQADSTVE